MSSKKTDTIYQQPLQQLTDFTFNKQVVSVFEDMINRSVPGYATIVHTIGAFAKHYVQDDSNCYDLGCSLGACTLSMRQQTGKRNNVTIYGIDSSSDMIRRAREFIAQDKNTTPVELITADINKHSIENASLVTLNFTLQFLDPDERDALIDRIYVGLKPGGCLVLSEKLRFTDPKEQAAITALHHDFKSEQGYSDLEISQKREALENVMRLDTCEVHLHRLRAAGFSTTTQWYQNTAFTSFLAIK